MLFRISFSLICIFWLIVSTLSASPYQLLAQPREEMVVNAGAPSGFCDVLKFLPDGLTLLAAGEDKRIWRIPYDHGDIHSKAPVAIRWPIYREQRGMITCLGLEPGHDPQLMAVGGYGILIENISILHVKTGETIAALPAQSSSADVWSVAMSEKVNGHQFVAFGNSVGDVYLWDRLSKGKVRQLGNHPVSSKSHGTNRVKLVKFLNNESIISVAEDGTVNLWKMQPDGNSKPTTIVHFANAQLIQAEISSNGEWLIAVGDTATEGMTQGRVLLYNLVENKPYTASLPHNHFAKRLAIDNKNQRVAVVTSVPPNNPTSNQFKPERWNVLIHDLKNPESTPVLTEIKSTHTIDTITFDPDGEHLIFSGGNDFEVAVWNVATQKQVSVLEQKGKGLWQVAYSQDGKSLGIRDNRNRNPISFNDWGEGEWNVFQISSSDVNHLGWHKQDVPFQPAVVRETSVEGWKIAPSTKSLFKWSVISPEGIPYELPLDEKIDQQPRCFTFLKNQPGQPVRLIVGHFLGATLFEMDRNNKPRKVRIFAGHAGSTSSLTVSPDESVLVTCSRDGTVAAYSLLPWASQAELGAAFTLKNGQLVLQSVDPGSPFWESAKNNRLNVLPGDVVDAFWYAENKWYDPVGYAKQDVNSVDNRNASDTELINAEQAIELLKHPAPRNLCMLHFAGKGWIKTSVRQMPVWKLFCARNPQTQRLQGGEWILWRWRDYFYTTSTRGDDLIGWQVNFGIDKTPLYYPAERFRAHFNKPEKVVEVLANISASPEWVTFADMMPPRVVLSMNETASSQLSGTQVIDVTLQQESEAVTEGSQPERVSVWLNDYKLPDSSGLKPVLNQRQQLQIPQSMLRTGEENVLTVKVFSKQRTRNEMELKLVKNAEPPRKVTLFGLLVGVSDYTLANQKRLVADKDLGRIEDWLRSQAGNELYDQVVIKKLQEAEVSAENFSRTVAELRKQVKPDDVVVILLSGHGIGGKLIKEVIKPEAWAGNEPSNYLYLLHNFDPANPLQTSLSDRFLAEQMSKITGHKVLFFDACHAAAGVNVLRELTPERICPAIFSACGSEERSYEAKSIGSGFFASALVQSTKPKVLREYGFQNKLKADKLSEFVRMQVPRALKQWNQENQQTPEYLPALPETGSKYLFGSPKQ